MKARTIMVAAGLALVLSSAATAGPQDKELAAETRALAALVADPLAEVEVGTPIPVAFRPLEEGGTAEGALVPFYVSGQHATNDAEEYVAYFHAMPQPDAYELDMLKSRKLAARHFMLVDFRAVGGRMWQQVDWSSARATGGKLVAKTVTWKDDDPACCPTGAGTVAISLGEDLQLRLEAKATP